MGHWYRKDGTPCHFIDGRDTTLRDARKLGLVPSVTEVLQLISRPGLERWKREQAVLSALTLPRLPDEASGALLARIDQDASRQAQEAADEGTAIHDAIEASFAAKPYPERYRPHVGAVYRMLEDNYPDVTDWVAEARFAHPSGFGGKVDIHSPSARIVGDYKGKDLAPDDDRQLAYDQHWQLGGYAIGLGWAESGIRGFNIFVSRSHPGHARFHEWTSAKMLQGMNVFRDTLSLWRSMKDYRP